MHSQRLNITLPHDLARDFKRAVPIRSRSKFIGEALKEKLSKKNDFKKNWIKALKANKEFYRKVAKEIHMDFKYADAEAFEKLP